MKSFMLTLPKSSTKIENHYFCECNNRFVNKEKCPICGNEKFFTYKDVKNYNPKLFEIEKTKNGIECFIEYPVFDNEIKSKRKRVAILIDKDIKLNKDLRENFDLYFEEISQIVKKYLKFLGLWEENKKI